MADWLALGPAPWWFVAAGVVLWLWRRERRVKRSVAEAPDRLLEQRQERAARAALAPPRNVIPMAARRPARSGRSTSEQEVPTQ